MAAPKTSTLTVRMDPDSRREAEVVPNQATREAIEEARNRKRLARFDTVESLYEDLGI